MPQLPDVQTAIYIPASKEDRDKVKNLKGLGKSTGKQQHDHKEETKDKKD